MRIQRHTTLKRLRLFKPLAFVVMVMLAALIVGFTVWPSHSILHRSSLPISADLRTYWSAGDIVVLVRHAERCDRSTSACIGPVDGITQEGRIEASQVGASFVALGMANTDVLSSPMTRTLQTAQAMFQSATDTQAWLESCNADLTKAILAHKVAGRNLILVTHSTCISQLETQLNHAYAPTAEYTSSLITQVAANGTLTMLGIVKPQDWYPVISGQGRAKSE
jgi:phosphohistidine phosphatase SixA